MSRTYRRKNSYEEFNWTFEREYYRTFGHHRCAYYRRYFEGQELKRELARYHADNPVIGWAIDAEFRRDLNRSKRNKNKQILRCAIRDCNDEPMFEPWSRDLQYNYW